jgi:hypothetical protein
MPSSPTELLIRKLSSQAGTRPALAAARFTGALVVVVVLALAMAAAVVIAFIGVRADLGVAAQRAPFQFKLASMLALACGSFFVVQRAAQTGKAGMGLLALVPGAALLVLHAAIDGPGLPLTGRSAHSVPLCLGTILILSIPALSMLLPLLRSGAPTRPGSAGAAVGVLSGALGAAAYALACKNDGALFVAIWYGAALIIMAGVGAAIGRRVLAW